MKIAYMLGSLNRGGMETLLLDVFKNARIAEYSFIGIHRKEGKYQSEFYDTRLMEQCSPRRGNYIGYLLRLRKLLITNGITIVHAQQYIDGLYAKLACIGTGIKVIETFHGYDFGVGKWNRLLIKLSIKMADAVLFVSNSQKEYYRKAYNLKCDDKISVVYNGVNFDKLQKRSSLSPKATSKLKFGTVGNFVPGREQSSLCRFLKLLKDRGVDFDFFFVGARSEKEPWQYDDCVQYCQNNGLADCVHFLGSRNDVPQLLESWDAFVYSTDHDTFGIAVIEAIASGLPTFVNDWEVMREITQNGTLATLYKTKDEADLLEKFMLFLQNRDSVWQKACDKADIARETYSIKRHLQSLNTIYQQINTHKQL